MKNRIGLLGLLGFLGLLGLITDNTGFYGFSVSLVSLDYQILFQMKCLKTM